MRSGLTWTANIAEFSGLACNAGTTSSAPPHLRTICHSWVTGLYEKSFGATFHQSKLRALAGLRLLCPADTSRGGNRRYYSIPDPDRLRKLAEQPNRG